MIANATRRFLRCICIHTCIRMYIHTHQYVYVYTYIQVLTRVAQDCNCNAALLELLNLVFILALQSELKIKLIEDGVVRVTLSLLGKKAPILKSTLFNEFHSKYTDSLTFENLRRRRCRRPCWSSVRASLRLSLKTNTPGRIW